MRKSVKVVIGITNILLLTALFFLLFGFYDVFKELFETQAAAVEFEYNATIVVHILLLTLLLFYIFYAALHKSSSPVKRILWVALLIIGSYLVMPVFWYFFIFSDKDSSQGDLQISMGSDSIEK